MSLAAYERETIIRFDDESNETTVYTCMRPMMTKLDKLVKSNPETYILVKEDSESKTYKIMNKKLVSFRTPTAKREYTDEQKLELSERGKRLAQSRINSTVKL